MSRDKQTEIDEMVMVLTESQHAFDRDWKECLHNNAPMPDRENVFYAKYLVEKEGYRKSTDFAEEIFAEIEKLLKENQFTLIPPYRSEITDWKTVFRLKLAGDIAELKKKYESEKDK